MLAGRVEVDGQRTRKPAAARFEIETVNKTMKEKKRPMNGGGKKKRKSNIEKGKNCRDSGEARLSWAVRINDSVPGLSEPIASDWLSSVTIYSGIFQVSPFCSGRRVDSFSFPKYLFEMSVFRGWTTTAGQNEWWKWRKTTKEEKQRELIFLLPSWKQTSHTRVRLLPWRENKKRARKRKI